MSPWRDSSEAADHCGRAVGEVHSGSSGYARTNLMKVVLRREGSREQSSTDRGLFDLSRVATVTGTSRGLGRHLRALLRRC
jgi:hypothetical protein